MRILFCVAAAVLFLATYSPSAFAQQLRPDNQQVMRKEITPENFSDMKALILTTIEKRRTRLDAEKACVEAAKNADELKKCRPERPMGMGNGMRQNTQGQPQGPGPAKAGQQ